MHYRHEINGLRAIAVIAIMLFHTQSTYFANAFIGVDLFFVISGYLITGLIIKAKSANQFSLIDFYLKRARRLIPALLVLILACVPVAWVWLFTTQFHDFSQSMIASNLFVSNILFWLEFQNYFSTGTVSKPLLHTWSLGVEEQFYIAYPLLLMALFHFFSKRFAVLGVLLLTGLFLIYTTAFIDNPLTRHYLPHSRFWLFGAGALVFFSRDQWPLLEFKLASYLGCIGLILIFLSLLIPSDILPSNSVNSLPYVGVLGISMVLLFSDKSNAVGRVLAIQPLAAIGVISYSLYLWHYPVFVFAHLRLLTVTPSLYLGLSVFAIVIAYLSWRFVEQPSRDKSQISNQRFGVYCLTGSFFIIGIGVYGVLKKGDVVGMTVDDTILESNYGLARNCGLLNRDSRCQTNRVPEILIWGDSFAMHSVDAVLATDPKVSITQFTLSACSPLTNIEKQTIENRRIEQCSNFNEAVLSSLGDQPSIKYLVISSRFSNYFNPQGYGRLSLLEKADYYKRVRKNLVRVLQRVRSNNVVPILIAEPRRPPREKIYCAAHSLKFSNNYSHCDFSALELSEAQREAARLLKSVAENYKVIWLDDYTCPQSRCKTVDDGVAIYTTGGHLSRRGASLLGTKLSVYEQIKSVKN